MIRDQGPSHSNDAQPLPVEPTLDSEQLSAAIDACPDCVLIMDGGGRILAFNPAAERTFGYARREVIGREFTEVLIPARLRERYRAGLRLEDGRTSVLGERVETVAVRANGSEFPVELTIAAGERGGEPFFTGYFRDISDRRHTDHQLQLRVAQQAAVAELGQEILATDDLQVLLDRTVQLVADALGNTLCQVLELEPDGTSFVMRAGVGWPEDVIGQARIGREGQAGYTVRTGQPVIVEDLREETRFTRIPLLAERAVVSGMSVLIAGQGDQPWGVLATHATERQQFAPEDVNFLQSVANTLSTALHQRRWEKSLIESEARARARADELDAIMESVPAVVWIAHDPAAERISGSRAAHEFLGMPLGSNLSKTPARDRAPDHFEVYEHGKPLEPEQLPVQRAARGETIGAYEEETRFADGTRKVLFGNATPLYDEQGQSRGAVAAFVEITARKHAEEERERLHARLENERMLMERILEQMPVGVIAVEASSGNQLFRNPQVEQITGRSETGMQPLERRDFQARSDEGWWYTADQWPLSRALRDGEVVAGEEMTFTHGDGHTRAISASATPIANSHGEGIAAVAVFYDITERKRREEANSFLAGVSDLLASSLEYEDTLSRIADLAVPQLADWCVVDIREPDQASIRRFAAHADPAKVELAQRLSRGRLLEADAERGVGKVMRTGEPEWASDISDEMLVQAARDEEHLRTLRELGLRSYISMPIKRRGTVLGAITLVTAESGPRDMEENLRLAKELTDRVALALENASLYQDARREVAERERAEQELRQFNEQLEQRVAERTAEIEERAGQLRALTAELTQAEQRERRRLAQVLHDHLQQLLVAGKFEIGSARSASDSEGVEKSLDRLHELLDRSIQESRSLTVELSPPVLYDAGLAAGLEWLGRWMQEQHGLAVDLTTTDGLDPVEEDLRVLLFEFVRELLFNVVKHAGADSATVTAQRACGGEIEIGVEDAGYGFDPANAEHSASHDRFGLFSVRERLARVGGELSVHSHTGAGTRAVLRVPDRSRSGEPISADAMPSMQPAVSGPSTANSPDRPARDSDEARQVIRVVLADDHEVVREGLARTVSEQPDLEVVGEAGDGQVALELVRSYRPAVVLLDVTMPGMDGIEAARRIMSEFPDIRLIGLSMHESADMAAAMREAGAAEYVDKAASSDRLLEAIRRS